MSDSADTSTPPPPPEPPFQQVVRARMQGLTVSILALVLGLIGSLVWWRFDATFGFLIPEFTTYGLTGLVFSALTSTASFIAFFLRPPKPLPLPLTPYARIALHTFMGGKRLRWTWAFLGLVLTGLAFWMPFQMGTPLLLALAFMASTFAYTLRYRLEDLIDEATETPSPTLSLPSVPLSPSAHAYTQDLLNFLQTHPELGQPQHHERLLGQARNVDSKGLELLLSRWPRLQGTWLSRTPIDQLSSAQTEALSQLVRAKPGVRGAVDFAFVGTKGSGRGTLVNVLTLGSLLHQEGTVHCISAEGPNLEHLQEGQPPRSAIEQFLSWVSDSPQLRSQVSTAFAMRNERLDLSQEKAVYFTDARAFVDELLSLAHHNQALPQVLQRLRYVIIDHPDQLTREELLRLRLSMSRLRLLLEAHDRHISFILLLPPLDNHAEFAKYLTCNDQVHICKFASPADPCELLTWRLPLSLEGASSSPSTLKPNAPHAHTQSYPQALQTLLSETVAFADQLVRKAHPDGPFTPLRIGIVDPLHRLGPEGQRELKERCLYRAGFGLSSQDTYRLGVEVHFLQGMQLTVDEDRPYDLVLSLALSAFPSWLINALRPALAKDGLLVLVSDESAEDLEALAQIQPGWRPFAPFIGQHSPFGLPAMPSAILAEAPEPLVGHELALLFSSCPQGSITVTRLRELFPGPFSAPWIERFVQAGALALKEAFYRLPNSHTVKALPLIEVLDLQRLHRLCPPLPWGCLSTDNVLIFDSSARSTAGIWLRRDISEYVDADRLFIDLFPAARLPFAPNTRVVSHVRTLEKPLSGGLMRELRLEQPGFEEALSLSERRLRTTLSAQDQAPLDEQNDPAYLVPSSLSPIAACLHQNGLSKRLAGLLAAGCRTFERSPSLSLAIGAWVMHFSEHFRDTLASPSEHPWSDRNPISLEHSPLLQKDMQRSYQSISLSLFWQQQDALPIQPSRPAFQALANLLKVYLKRAYLKVGHELDVAVLPLEVQPPSTPERALPRASSAPSLLPWRLVLRRLHQGEVGALSGVEKALRERLLNGQWARWAKHQLEVCDCPNGCLRCCGGLGYIAQSPSFKPSQLYQADDVISAQGAYALVCELLGESPQRTWPPEQNTPLSPPLA